MSEQEEPNATMLDDILRSSTPAAPPPTAEPQESLTAAVPPPVTVIPSSIGFSGGTTYALGSGSGSGRKKRGRPRKYGPEAAIPISCYLPLPPAFLSSPPPQTTAPPLHHQMPPPPPQHHQTPPDSARKRNAKGKAKVNPDSDDPRTNRKRPTSPFKIHRGDVIGIAGSPTIGLTLHALIVDTGEDVAARIISFSLAGPRSLCVISATGALSNVTLRQIGTSESMPNNYFKGNFEILSLCGTLTFEDASEPHRRAGSLTITLSAADGRLLGGRVSGVLTAATEVKLLLGSFVPDVLKVAETGNQADARKEPETENQAGP